MIETILGHLIFLLIGVGIDHLFMRRKVKQLRMEIEEAKNAPARWG